MEAAAYPREKPWRVFWKLLAVDPLAPRAGKLALLLSLLVLWTLSMSLLGEGEGFTQPLLGAALSLPELVLLWLLVRGNALRASFLTQPGVELPPELSPHPLIGPAVVTLLVSADALLALLAARFLTASAALWVTTAATGASLLALPALRLVLRGMRLQVTADGIVIPRARGQELEFAAVQS